MAVLLVIIVAAAACSSPVLASVGDPFDSVAALPLFAMSLLGSARAMLRYPAAARFRSANSNSAGQGELGALPDSLASIQVRTLHLRNCHSDNWDAFAQGCGASFRSSHAWLRGWSIKSAFRYRLTLVEFYKSGRKIGQCAVGLGMKERVFLDQLALRPGNEALWSDCMKQILTLLGPGRYRYGWHLSLEQPREHDLGNVPGVAIESVCPLTVHAVDFNQWQSWDEYWNSTSSNTRRNAKRAEAKGLNIVSRQGHACLLCVSSVLRLRSATYARKGLRFQPLGSFASYIGTHLVAPQYRLVGFVQDAEKVLAAFIGVEFGTHTYYLDGGSHAANNGAAWYLQKRMLQRTWERHPGRGKFVMGYVDYATHDERIGGGLLRSRRAVRARAYETSTVLFSYCSKSFEEYVEPRGRA
jgi:hypothetical protein